MMLTENCFVTFRHYRYYDCTYANLDPLGGLTVCVLVDPTAEQLRVSFAECSRKDNFARKTGQELSWARMNSKNSILTHYNAELSIHQNLLYVAEDLGFSTDIRVMILASRQ